MRYRQQVLDNLLSTVVPGFTPWRTKTTEYSFSLFSGVSEERKTTYAKYAIYEVTLISWVDDAPKLNGWVWVVETYFNYMVDLDNDEIREWHVGGIVDNLFGKPRYRLSRSLLD